jgi:glycerol-3-phosphate cytidylyltransferase-like family protein
MIINESYPNWKGNLAERKCLMKQGKVLYGGAFDILHPGHIRALRHAKECGNYLVVCLTPDSRIIKKKKF